MYYLRYVSFSRVFVCGRNLWKNIFINKQAARSIYKKRQYVPAFSRLSQYYLLVYGGNNSICSRKDDTNVFTKKL